MITIEQDGSLSVERDSIKRFLKRHAGKWRIMSTIPRLLVLQKLEGKSAGEARALLNGSVERPGWLVEIINFISNSRLSGDLVCVSDNVQRELLFEKGALRIAFSTSRKDLLGEFILSEGILNREQLQTALKAQTPNKRLGQILVEQGLLTGADVYSILQRKTQRVFYDTIAVGEGVYYFITEYGPLKLPASMYMDTQALLMEGVKRIDDLEFYNNTVPRRTARLASVPGPLDGYSEMERRFIELIDGRRTLAAIDQYLHLGVDEAMAMVLRFASKDLVTTMSARDLEEQTIQSAVNSFNQALDTIFAALGEPGKVAEVNKIGADFAAGGTHGNKSLQKLQPDSTGHLQVENLQNMYRESEERDKVKLVVMVLTQYISFVLFNAIERLPVEKQEPLSSQVNEYLSEIFAANL